MSRRFNLDPRAPSPARAPQPPPAAAAQGRAPPPAPDGARASSSAPAPAAAGRKKVLLVGGAILAILLVGGAFAIYAATELGYPHRYLLEEDEMPSGVRPARLSSDEMQELGIRKNPGEMDRERFRDSVGGMTDEEPLHVHAQVLSDMRGSRIILFAMEFATEDEARSTAQDARLLCSGRFGPAASVLRDGDILVVALPEGASQTTLTSVVRALMEKSDLTPECGAR